MNKYILSLTFSLIATAVIAQLPQQKAPDQDNTVQKQIDSVCKLVVKYSNEKATDSLYALTGEAFRSQMDYNTFKSIAETHLYPQNAIIRTELMKHEEGRSTYKVSFSNFVALLDLSLDEQRKLVAFLWKPAEE